ncbi:MAG: hypothetical protein M1832_004591 [Thelocarpon impressellum]|nr:MAG: hypothetical protein M1832_004591 [Thelocarpon impressellum]
MDYSYFTAPQPYQFLGLPPTPDTTNPPNSEEAYSNGSPPDVPDSAGSLPFEPFAARFGAGGNGVPPQPAHSPAAGGFAGTGGAGANMTYLQRAGAEMSFEDHEQRNNRSSSEEKEAMTPAKSRRKAQNRAAQRAFRERKDRYLKDVEQKLHALEATSSTLMSDNERLKREVEKLASENEILRSTSRFTAAAAAAAASSSGPAHAHAAGVSAPPSLSFTPTDFYSSVLHAHEDKTPSHRVTVSEVTGERLLAAGATWDYIVGHELFRKGLVDAGDVCERLKPLAKCDGQGPSFEERAVREAIEESAASGNDELI